MPDNMLLELMRLRLTLLERAVAAWRKNIADVYRGDIDGAIHECLGLPADFRRLHNAVFDRIAAGHLEDLNGAGREYQAVYDQALRLLPALQEAAGAFPNKERLLLDPADLLAIVAELNRMRKEVFDPWPWFTQESLDEGRAEMARGEYVTVEEALNELRRPPLAPGGTPADLLEPPRHAPR